MTDFYLITGFLGAGKTSLLANLLPQFADRNVRLIVNEFGKVGLDGTLLREQGAKLSQIVNGSVFCVCRLDQFEAALEEAISDAPDVIFVEASGLSDPGSIRSILEQYEKTGRLRYRGAVCLVDAPRFRKVVSTARACKKQLAIADLVLVNKCDLAGEQECRAVEALLQTLSVAACVRTTFGAITREQLEQIFPEKHAVSDDHKPDLTLQKATLAVSGDMTKSQLAQVLELVCQDAYRVKGLVSLGEGPFLVDCVGTDICMKPYAGTLENENRLTLLAGEGMPLRKTIQRALGQFDSLIALERNTPNDA